MTEYPALVLNASYEPLNLYPLSLWGREKVFRGVAAGKVDVVERYDAVMRSAHAEWQPPSVVALKRYVRTPDRVPFSRMNILVRDRSSCQYCGVKLRMDELTFDHVVPRSVGGKTNFENIVSACVPCNAKKANKRHMRPMQEPVTPTQRQMAALRPISAKDVPESWISWLSWAGAMSDVPLGDRTLVQQATDEGYWELPLNNDSDH